MVKIRLTRLGRNKLPYYRIVVVDSRNRRDSSYIELLGHYEPFSGKIDLKKDLVIKWLKNGAQPSETILSILKKEGVWKEYQLSKKPKKNKKRKLSSAKKSKKVENKSKSNKKNKTKNIENNKTKETTIKNESKLENNSEVIKEKKEK